MNKITLQLVDQNTANGIYTTYLVRGVGKRAILVRLKDSGNDYTKEQNMKLVVAVAIEANKQGKKKVVFSYAVGDLVKMTNWSTWYEFNFTNIYRNSKTLGHVKSVLKQDIEFEHLIETDKGWVTNNSFVEGPSERECILCNQGIQHANCDYGF